MSANPSTNWYWNDWDNDRALALCSLAAQGLWMRMLSIAARTGGYVSVKDAPCSNGDIALLVGRPLSEVEPLIDELDQRGVFSRSRNGTIYNRRMLRDQKRRETNQKNGKLGGNPSLRKQTDISSSDIRSHNPRPTEVPTPLNPIPLAQDISDSPDGESSLDRAKSVEALTSSAGELTKSAVRLTNGHSNGHTAVEPLVLTPTEEGPKEIAEAMLVVWIENCGHMHRPLGALRKDRITKLHARWRDSFGRDMMCWRAFCARVRDAPHLRGENDRGWTANLDWVLEPRNLRKIEEGRYDAKQPTLLHRAPEAGRGRQEPPGFAAALRYAGNGRAMG